MTCCGKGSDEYVKMSENRSDRKRAQRARKLLICGVDDVSWWSGRMVMENSFKK